MDCARKFIEVANQIVLKTQQAGYSESTKLELDCPNHIDHILLCLSMFEFKNITYNALIDYILVPYAESQSESFAPVITSLDEYAQHSNVVSLVLDSYNRLKGKSELGYQLWADKSVQDVVNGMFRSMSTYPKPQRSNALVAFFDGQKVRYTTKKVRDEQSKAFSQQLIDAAKKTSDAVRVPTLKVDVNPSSTPLLAYDTNKVKKELSMPEAKVLRKLTEPERIRRDMVFKSRGFDLYPDADDSPTSKAVKPKTSSQVTVEVPEPVTFDDSDQYSSRYKDSIDRIVSGNPLSADSANISVILNNVSNTISKVQSTMKYAELKLCLSHVARMEILIKKALSNNYNFDPNMTAVSRNTIEHARSMAPESIVAVDHDEHPPSSGDADEVASNVSELIPGGEASSTTSEMNMNKIRDDLDDTSSSVGVDESEKASTTDDMMFNGSSEAFGPDGHIQ